MTMKPSEICRLYRTSKNPRQQVKILAELNCCTIADITTLLIQSGEPIRSHRGNSKQVAVRLLDTDAYKAYAEYNKQRRG